MDITQVLQRAWHAMWRHRALWLFGLVLALTATSWEVASLSGLFDEEDWRYRYRGTLVHVQPGESFFEAFRRAVGEEYSKTRKDIIEAEKELDRFFAEVLHLRIKSNIPAYLAALAALGVAAYLAVTVARYVSETALIRMVDRIEETGERVAVWEGFRLGWSRTAWRLFFIDLLVDVPTALLFAGMFSLVVAQIWLWVEGSDGVVFAGAFLTGGLLLLLIALAIVAGAVLGVVKRLARRACALEGRGPVSAIGRGYTVLRGGLKSVGLVWLLATGIRFAWRFAMAPVVLALLAVGLVFGGLPGVLAGAVAGRVWVGLALGIPVFLAMLFAPLLFLAALREVFLSSMWTVTYRELHAVGQAERTGQAQPDRQSLGTAPAD